MADSRSKGAAFERDVCKRLNTFFVDEGIDLSVKRNLDQYQAMAGGTLPLGGIRFALRVVTRHPYWFGNSTTNRSGSRYPYTP